MKIFGNSWESNFKKDKNGNEVFFPFRAKGKGYELPNKESKLKIKRFLTIYFITTIPFVFLMGAITRAAGKNIYSILFLAVFILFLIIYFWIYALLIKRHVRNFPISREKLTVEEILKKTNWHSRSDSFDIFIVMFIIFSFFLYRGINFVINHPDQFSLGMWLFFLIGGICQIFIARRIYFNWTLKKKDSM